MNSDSRTHYIRLSKSGFSTLPVRQAFLSRRPLVKTPADEQAEPPVEVVYYEEADEITFEEAMRLYAPQTVALMDESGGGAPVNLGTLAEYETLPEEMTHAFFGLHNLSSFEIADIVYQASSLNIQINQVLIPWGEPKDNYLKTGALPS